MSAARISSVRPSTDALAPQLPPPPPPPPLATMAAGRRIAGASADSPPTSPLVAVLSIAPVVAPADAVPLTGGCGPKLPAAAAPDDTPPTPPMPPCWNAVRAACSAPTIGDAGSLGSPDALPPPPAALFPSCGCCCESLCDRSSRLPRRLSAPASAPGPLPESPDASAGGAAAAAAAAAALPPCAATPAPAAPVPPAAAAAAAAAAAEAAAAPPAAPASMCAPTVASNTAAASSRPSAQQRNPQSASTNALAAGNLNERRKTRSCVSNSSSCAPTMHGETGRPAASHASRTASSWSPTWPKTTTPGGRRQRNSRIAAGESSCAITALSRGRRGARPAAESCSLVAGTSSMRSPQQAATSPAPAPAAVLASLGQPSAISPPPPPAAAASGLVASASVAKMTWQPAIASSGTRPSA